MDSPRPRRQPRLAFSVDLDEWFHARWATGYRHSLWPDLASCFSAVYGTNHPRGDLLAPAQRLLAILAERGVQATFFVLGEVAGWYPELVRAIAAAGHEVACHGLHHVDMSELTREQFTADLRTARSSLEQLTGQPVLGYRAPNLVVMPWLADVLAGLGFAYDSSVCPARGFRGKYAGMVRCPQHPYRAGATIQELGDGPLWEVPIPTFPGLRWPAATGIATRGFGVAWTRFALRWWERTGSVLYYLHPYEIGTDPVPAAARLYVRLFMRNRGAVMQRRLEHILDGYRGRVCSIRALLSELDPGWRGAVPRAAGG
jgi:polysaccharide deacetylase family protein (PEP-CTERM system associated)